MPRWEGFAYAAGAAIGHSCIDTSRKIASQRFSSAELVGLVGIFDALFLSAFVMGSGLLSSLQFMTIELIAILASSAGLKIFCAFMYQRALQVSPLSVTVPYLAFTPALIIFTSYVMVRELPNFQGLAGVLVVTTGGYLLALESAKLQSSKKGKQTPIFPSSPSAENVELSEVVSKGPSGVTMSVSSRILEAGAPGSLSKSRLLKEKDFVKEMQVGVDAQYEANVMYVDVGLTSGDASRAASNPSTESKGVEGMLSRPRPVEDLEAPLLQKPEIRVLSLERVAGVAGGLRPKQLASKTQASEPQEEASLRFRMFSKPSSKGSDGNSTPRQGRKATWAFLRLLWSRVGRISEPLLALRREEGSGLMLGCAALLSLTNNLDKMGSHISPSVIVFACAQRIFMAGPPVVFLVCTSPRSLYGLVRHFPILASISFFEIVAIVGYLKSLEYILVSYSVATKRTNILLSVLVGNIIFKEDIWRRLPHIFLMMTGMTMIVFA